MIIPFKKSPILLNVELLSPSNIFDLLPDDHNTDDKEPLRQQMNVKMEQQASKDIYSKRKVIVEPVFGQLKNSGFRGFSVRGKEKVAGEFSLVCATHNIKKIVKAIFTGVVRPEFSQLATNPAI